MELIVFVVSIIVFFGLLFKIAVDEDHYRIKGLHREFSCPDKDNCEFCKKAN